MITNKEITNFIANEIESFQDEIKALMGQKALIFIGIDTNIPPQKEDLPAIAIEPTIKKIGDSESNFDYEIVVRVGVLGSERPIRNNNIILYDGVYKVEELGNLVVDKLRKAFECKTNLDMFDIDFYQDEIVNFPIYTGSIIIGFSVENVIGDSKIEFNK